jgi:hypothetical protein
MEEEVRAAAEGARWKEAAAGCDRGGAAVGKPQAGMKLRFARGIRVSQCLANAARD